jgi:hypothetical protein
LLGDFKKSEMKLRGITVVEIVPVLAEDASQDKNLMLQHLPAVTGRNIWQLGA